MTASHSTTTTHAVRAAIQRSQASLAQLSKELGINPSKFAVTQLVEKADRKTAWEFLEHLLKAVPYRIHTILTDNGIQFGAMRLLAERGKPLLLVSGWGDVLGDWVTTGIEEKGCEFLTDGAPGVIAFTMSAGEPPRHLGS